MIRGRNFVSFYQVVSECFIITRFNKVTIICFLLILPTSIFRRTPRKLCVQAKSQDFTNEISKEFLTHGQENCHRNHIKDESLRYLKA